MTQGNAPRSIGVVITGYATLGIVESGQVAGPLVRYPAEGEGSESLSAMPADELVRALADEIKALAEGEPVEAIGVACPGIIRNGVVEESPNFAQLKGFPLGNVMRGLLEERGLQVRIAISNDADTVASGIAAAHGKLDKLVRVWTLGDGIGFGRYPVADGVWEGGHMVVTLDPNERFCGCGGLGHLESIMGHRAMRLRFLDMEPEEVFAAAKSGGNPRCAEFAILWHRALAAATASSVHMSGPGKFYITGPNSRFVNVPFLNRCAQDMVKMSLLQGYVFEVVPRSDEFAVIGAVVNALRT
jgi:glucokinase